MKHYLERADEVVTPHETEATPATAEPVNTTRLAFNGPHKTDAGRHLKSTSPIGILYYQLAFFTPGISPDEAISRN